jgi:hypothetical protein
MHLPGMRHSSLTGIAIRFRLAGRAIQHQARGARHRRSILSGVLAISAIKYFAPAVLNCNMRALYQNLFLTAAAGRGGDCTLSVRRSGGALFLVWCGEAWAEQESSDRLPVVDTSKPEDSGCCR